MNLSLASDIVYNGLTVDSVWLGSTKIWPLSHDYSQDYLTIVSLENNNVIKWAAWDSSIYKTIEVSTDNGATWVSVVPNVVGRDLATLNAGDKLLVKGNNSTYASSANVNHFSSSGNIDVQGNIMSLIYGDNFVGQTSLTEYYAFSGLFIDSKVVNANNLVLPATTISYGCYRYLFYNCALLVNAPTILPALTLTDFCYQQMFYNCPLLVTTPILPATTLNYDCYVSMFEGCTSLTVAPALPATTIISWCYASMFKGCTSLTVAPELLATIFSPRGGVGCYSHMFEGCTSLNYVKCILTDLSESTNTEDWLNGVAQTGTFIKDANTTWPSGQSGIPSGWTVQDYVA